MTLLRACILDIETTDLSAVGMGWITCAVVLPVCDKPEPVVFRYDEYHCPYGVETKLVRALLNHLKEYDVIIGHNIKNFDIPFIHTRAVILGVPFPENQFLYYDTMEGFKRTKLRTRLNQVGRPKASLDHIYDLFYGIERDDNPKTAIYPQEAGLEVWGQGQKRKEAIDKKVAHCIADVHMTLDVFHKVFPADPKRSLKLIS